MIRVHTGDDITFKVDQKRQFTIETKEANFEAASGNFFVLRNPNGEVISGSPVPKPLGWYMDEYYITAPKPIESGLWTVEVGSLVTIHLTNASVMTVKESLQKHEMLAGSILITIIGVLIWIIGIAIGKQL